MAAVDTASGEEVVITGPASALQSDLERVAARKLQRRLEAAGILEPESKTPRPGDRGVIT